MPPSDAFIICDIPSIRIVQIENMTENSALEWATRRLGKLAEHLQDHSVASTSGESSGGSHIVQKDADPECAALGIQTTGSAAPSSYDR